MQGAKAMDVAVSLRIVASPPRDLPPGVVLGISGLARLHLEISKAKNHVYKMSKPPGIYGSTIIRPA